MKRAIVFYSYTGKTEKLARELADREGAELLEVKDSKRPGILQAYTAGCLAAMGMRRRPIDPPEADLSAYDAITLMAPVWAGHPAPAANSVFDLLPKGKDVSVCMVSGSGRSRCRDKVQAEIEAKGCRMTDFRNLRG